MACFNGRGDVSDVSDVEKGVDTTAGAEAKPELSPTSTVFSFVRRSSKSFSAWRSSFSESRKPVIQADHKPSQPECIVRNLQDCPQGYPRLAAFLDSDESFMVYRRFGYLQARVLLEKQDELRRLETKLQKLDEKLERQGKEDEENYLRTLDLDEDIGAPREKLIAKIEKAFCEYANLMTAAKEMVALNRPAPPDYRSVKNWLWSNHPQCAEEESWIHCREDLVTLRPGREHAWLDSGIEHLLRWLHCSIIERLFCSRDTRRKSTSKNEVYYDRPRINGLVAGIITCMLLVLLVVPVYILYHLVDTMGTERTDGTCIGTLLVFTLAFSAVLSLFTRAKRHEVLGAAAGYCAILVVFLGNVGNNQH